MTLVLIDTYLWNGVLVLFDMVRLFLKWTDCKLTYHVGSLAMRAQDFSVPNVYLNMLLFFYRLF